MKWHNALGHQEGSSLLITLVMITIMTVLIGAVLALYLAQYRFFRRDAHRLQARYVAEAAVYIAIDSLQHDLRWRPHQNVLALPEAQTGVVHVETFGGYLYIRATAHYRRSQSTVRALIGVVPAEDFQHAVYLWDTASRMHVAGTTHITGDILVGPRGVRESTFKRRRFTGKIEGATYRVADLEAPFYEGIFLSQALEAVERYLELPSTSLLSFPEAERALAQRLPSENGLVVVGGSLHLTAADSLLLQEPMTIVARENLILEGPLRFAPGSMFIAGQGLTVKGGVLGRDGLFFGRDRVETIGAVLCAGQFFSRKQILITKGAYLRYPTMLYIAGDAAEAGGQILVADGAVVNGSIIHPPLDPVPTVAGGRIVVERRAQVRGALFNAHETEFHGTLHGSLLTHQLYFYESPTRYVNWLKDATIDVGERPVSYALPLGFSPQPRLVVLQWDSYTS